MPLPPIDDRVIPAVRYIETTTTTTATQMPVARGMGIGSGHLTGQTGNTIATLSNYTTMDLVQMFVVYAFIAAAGLSAVFIFIGGINFILSGGNDEKIKAAVNTIRYAIVGLIVTILSFTAVTIMGRVFGLDFMSYLSYKDIRASISQLIDSSKTTGAGSSAPHFSLPTN
jgi:cytochrome bd-type quinol oxidase subunit 2